MEEKYIELAKEMIDSGFESGKKRRTEMISTVTTNEDIEHVQEWVTNVAAACIFYLKEKFNNEIKHSDFILTKEVQRRPFSTVGMKSVMAVRCYTFPEHKKIIKIETIESLDESVFKAQVVVKMFPKNYNK